MVEKTLIFTILYHRLDMVRFSALNVVTYARNARYVLWDNSEDCSLQPFCMKLIEQNTNPSVEILYAKSASNIGLNAAKRIVDRFSHGCTYIMSIDEDILYLPFHFQSTLQGILNTPCETPIGYVACNVFQDSLTNGAKFPDTHYREVMVGPHRVQLGPTGGWGTMFRKDVYQKVGGYEEREHIFFGLDGVLSEKMTKHGFYQGIAKDVTCYHATGPTWNNHFKYDAIHAKKYDEYEKSKK